MKRPVRTTPPVRKSVFAGVWEGTVAVTLDHNAPCGSGFEWVKVGTQSLSYGAQVVVSAPLPGDSNAFQLSISTRSQAVEGGFTMVSSGRFNTSSGPLTLAYWQLSENSGKLTGRLTDTHRAEGVAQNLLYTNKSLDPCSNRLGSVLVPLAMDVATTIQGTLGSSSGSLVVSGRTTDWLRDYRLTFDLDRVS